MHYLEVWQYNFVVEWIGRYLFLLAVYDTDWYASRLDAQRKIVFAPTPVCSNVIHKQVYR